MRLKVWINAFIPKTVPGYTQVIRSGPHAGKSAVPLPGLARLNPFNTFKDLDAGYLTDQRSFSNSPTASVRMQSLAEISLSPKVSVFKSSHKSSGTTEIDLDTGKALGFAVADVSRCRFAPLSTKAAKRSSRTYRTFPMGVPFSVNRPATGTPIYQLQVLGQASDPLVSAAADIDYDGTFEITIHPRPWKCFVEFTGRIDAFPAFECYAQLDGRTKCLFTAPPPSGNTVTNLPGTASRRISGMVSFP